MSNELTAQNLAAYGRGPDSMLVHMAPQEVAGLQALAKAHGGSLTINPETGLPEAGFLSSILPMIAGAALTGLTGGVINPLTASMLVGGGTALATGSLQKGLMAGLGAYGGAGIGAGLMGAGAGAAAQAGAVGSGVTEAALGELGMNTALMGGAGEAALGELGINTALGAGVPGGIAAGTSIGTGLPATATTAAAPMGAGAQMWEGAKSAVSGGQGFNQFLQGMGGGKQAAMYGLAALSPMMMAQQGLQVPTATQSPGMIRPYTNDRRQTSGTRAPGAPYTSERRWFEGSLTPQTPYEAGSQDYAYGGNVEDMSNRNAGLMQLPYAQGGSMDAQVDPYSGAAAFAEGGVTPGVNDDYIRSIYAKFGRTGDTAPTQQEVDWWRNTTQEQGMTADAMRQEMLRAAIRNNDGTTLARRELVGYDPARPVTRPVEENPYFSMTGQSGDAFRYLMGQQPASFQQPASLQQPQQPPQAAPTTPAPGGGGNPQFGNMPQYYKDPVTGRLVQTYVPTTTSAPDQARAATGEAPDFVGGTGMARGGYTGGGLGDLGGYSDGGRLLRGPGDGVSDSIPAQINGRQPARLADGEFVVPARIVSEIGNGSTDAGARKLYAMMDRIQKARKKTVGKNAVAKDTKAEKYLPA